MTIGQDSSISGRILLAMAFVVIVFVMLSPGGFILSQSNGFPMASAPPQLVPSYGRNGPAVELAQAVDSLGAGEGPAHGWSVACTTSTFASSCAAYGTAAPHPHGSSSSNLTWTDMTPQLPSAPVPMYLASMAYDYSDGYVLLFGGYSSSGSVLSQTWIFSNGSWSQLSVTGPSPEYVGTMAYDFADHYVLMFGGYSGSGSGYYNATWTFSNGTWTELFPSSAPSARWRQAMAWDGTDNCVVLYGGTTASVDLGDTWTYAHGTWKNVTKNVTGHPPPTFRGAMAWDGSDGYDILFGGVMVGGFGSTSGSNYTWAYANLTWKNLTKTAGHAPSARLYETMVWDNATDSVVLFGGAATDSSGVTNDTWYFHNGTWRDESKNFSTPPSPRAFQMSAYVPQADYVMIFAGYNLATYYNDTWGLGAPVLATLSVAPAEIDLGQSLSIQASAFSAHRPLAYAYSNLPPGCRGGNVTQISCTPTSAGSFTINLSATDTKGDRTNQSAVAVVATPPVLTGFKPSRSPVTQGEPTVLMVTVQGGAPPLVYSYSRLPFGCSNSNTALLTCRPANPGTYTIQVQVTDYFGYVVSGTTTLTVVPTGKVTVFVATPSTLDVNTTTVLTVEQVNGTAPYSYAYTGLPPGCTSANTAHLSCTPTAVNTSTVTVVVTDSSGSHFSATESVIVNPDLSITSFNASATSLDQGQSVLFVVKATGGTGVDVWSYSGLPPGCNFVGGVSNRCTPSQIGSYSVMVTGVDAVNSTANATVNLTIAAPPAAVLSVSPVGTDVYLPFTVTTSVTGGFPPYLYSYGGLPTGCGSPTTATFSCTSAAPNRFSIYVEVTDSVGGHGARDYLNQTVNPLPTVTAFAVETANPTVGKPAVMNLTVQGGTGVDRFAYSGLPAGCNSENSTVLNCTPSVAGDFEVSVLITDARGKSGGASAWFNVSAASTTSTGLFGLPGSEGLLLIVALVVILAAAGVGIVMMRRRRRNPPAAAPAPEEPGSRDVA